jgi:hypothetical protein
MTLAQEVGDDGTEPGGACGPGGARRDVPAQPRDAAVLLADVPGRARHHRQRRFRSKRQHPTRPRPVQFAPKERVDDRADFRNPRGVPACRQAGVPTPL